LVALVAVIILAAPVAVLDAVLSATGAGAEVITNFPLKPERDPLHRGRLRQPVLDAGAARVDTAHARRVSGSAQRVQGWIVPAVALLSVRSRVASSEVRGRE
jgi:hypothetical protein